jgi:sugar lactone lactonase YvrE
MQEYRLRTMKRPLVALLRRALLGLALPLGCAPTSTAPAPAVVASSPPSNPLAYDRAVHEAVARSRARDHRAAARAYEQALASNPGDDVLVYLIARSSLRAGDPEGAMRWLTRLADSGSDLVPTPADFHDLAESPAQGAAYRAVVQRTKASAARHRRGVEAFRVTEKGLLPEGIAYDPVERAFYMGSTTRRKIVKIVEGRAPVDFVAPRPDLDSLGGLRVDVRRRRLWAVSGGDPRQDGYTASMRDNNELFEIDLATGAVVSVVALHEAGRHGLNDVAIDAEGRPFSTDYVSGQIYTLAADRRSLVPLFDAPPFVGPNGIAFDDEGKVLFVADDVGVHRIDVAARAARRLPQPVGTTLASIDGLYFVRTEGGPRLVGIQGAGPGRVVEATLRPALDAVTRVEILESDHPLFEGPTTGAVVGSALFLIANSQLWEPLAPAEAIILKVRL